MGCVQAFARVRTHACACVRVCVRPCVREVFAIYDNTILYFIQSHTLMISPQRVPVCPRFMMRLELMIVCSPGTNGAYRSR